MRESPVCVFVFVKGQELMASDEKHHDDVEGEGDS